MAHLTVISGGNSLTVTDGTHTVTSVEQITVIGGTVGGMTPDATVTISGGSAGIIPEGGPTPIKISAFPTAPLNFGVIGDGDLVTGLQGGVNQNFNKQTLFTGRAATVSAPGEPSYLYGGAGSSTEAGGSLTLNAGTGFTGGRAYLYGGNSIGSGQTGGSLEIGAGNSALGVGGDTFIYAGTSNASSGSYQGGSVFIYSGAAGVQSGNTGSSGSINLTAAAGQHFSSGGPIFAHAGNSGNQGGNGGLVGIYGGNAQIGSALGGNVSLTAGTAVNGTGGGAYLVAGGTSGSGSGGTVKLYSGGSSSGAGGNVIISPATGGGSNGHLVIKNLPTSSAGLPSGAVWNSSGVLHIV